MTLSTVDLGSDTLRGVTDALEGGVVILDGQGRIEVWNLWMAKASGLSPGEVLGRPLTEVFPELHDSHIERRLEMACRRGMASMLSHSMHPAPLPLKGFRRTHEPFDRIQQSLVLRAIDRLEDGWRVLLHVNDVSRESHREQVLRAQAKEIAAQKAELETFAERMRMLAQRDTLTGLRSRGAFVDALERMVVRAAQEETTVSVLFMDLDGFKPVNDRLGHDRGDDLLRQLGARLQETVREGDIVGRIGGDEFVVALEESTAAKTADAVAQRILDAVGRPFRLGPHVVEVGASLGVARHGVHGTSAADLLRFADQAMYAAKRSGGRRVHEVDPSAAPETAA